jgi:hypothetical protein
MLNWNRYGIILHEYAVLKTGYCIHEAFMADHSDNPLTRWGRINLELYYRGFHTEQIICNFEFHESVQRRYYGDPSGAWITRYAGRPIRRPQGLLQPDPYALHANKGPRLVSNTPSVEEITAIFSAERMAIVDLASVNDDFDLDFCIWFHEDEGLPHLRKSAVTPERIEHRLAFISESLHEKRRLTVQSEVHQTAYGWHGHLTADKFGKSQDVPGEIELDIGPWGWTRWEHGEWQESHSYTATEEAGDLGITVLQSSHQPLRISAIPTKRRYYDVEVPHDLPTIHWTEVVVAAATACVVMPFMKAFSQKAGEDCYQALRTWISRAFEEHKRWSYSDQKTSKQISIIDEATDAELIFTPPLPEEAISQLAAMDPKRLRRRTAEWNPQSSRWEISDELRPKPRRWRGGGSNPS